MTSNQGHRHQSVAFAILPMQFKALVNLTLDNPDADGRVTVWGVARDWPASEPKASLTSYTPDLGGEYGWEYGQTFEYIERLKAIAPLGTGTRANMALTDWTVSSGLWRETPTAGTFKANFLHYYDGGANKYATGDYGVIQSNADHGPDLLFYIRRYPSDTADTDPPLFCIVFYGDGTGPQYQLVLPAFALGGTVWRDLTGTAGSRLQHPFLLGLGPGLSGAGQWKVIDECKSGGAPQRTQGDEDEGYHVQVVKIEYTDGWLLVNFSGASQTWAYSGDWIDALGRTVPFSMPTGPIGVNVCGHTAAFLMADLCYPTSHVLDASAWLRTAANLEPTPNYSALTYEPAGTSIAIAEHPSSVPGVSKPRATFTSTGAARAVLYNIAEWRDATIGAANSVPVSSVANDDLRVIEASGTLNDQWRGATATVTVRAKNGHTLPDIQPNGKVLLDVGLKETAAAPTFMRQHTGYVLPPEYELSAPSRTTATIHCADGVEVRLQHKTMLWTCSFEGWTVGEAFSYILNRSGVPDTMIAIDAAITADPTTYTLPIGNPKGERVLKFRPDEGVVNALDTICETRDCQWGVDQDGDYFVRPRLQHTPGYYDWTLDADTLGEDEIVYSFRAAQTLDDYCNVLYVLAGNGVNAQASLLWDYASITDDTAGDFIGDDWWQVVVKSDADDPAQVAALLWARRAELSQAIFFTLRSHPELLPDQYVYVQNVGCGVADGSIFRITRKSWRVGADGADFQQDFEAVLVEEP